MKINIPAVAALIVGGVVLAGCVETSGAISETGAGKTNSGETLNGFVKARGDGRDVLSFTSSVGWTCTGAFIQPTTAPSASFPINCTNGKNGTAVIRNNNSGIGQTVSYSLAGGGGGYVLVN